MPPQGGSDSRISRLSWGETRAEGRCQCDVDFLQSVIPHDGEPGTSGREGDLGVLNMVAKVTSAY